MIWRCRSSSFYKDVTSIEKLWLFNSFFWHLLPGVSEREFVERKTPQRVLQEQTEEMLSEPEKVIYYVIENEIALGF